MTQYHSLYAGRARVRKTSRASTQNHAYEICNCDVIIGIELFANHLAKRQLLC